MKEEVVSYFKSLQGSICNGLELADGSAKFKEDLWTREARPDEPFGRGGGGGRTRIIQGGSVIEKGGVNFSEVWGEHQAHPPPFPKGREENSSVIFSALPDTTSRLPLGEEGRGSFYATGVSLVIHPQSPMVPIIHMNVRYLELSASPLSPLLKERSGSHQADGVRQWFGGGIDLTPIYVDEDDAKYFHQTLKATCDRFHPSFYPDFKKWADDYFFIKHRNETRGVGGIFFDHIGRTEQSLKIPLGQFFEFLMTVGNVFLPTYTHLIKMNKDKKFTEREKQWQLLRRGRYAEFNLVYDRGTKFGLETNSRTESILMSLPPQANWAYNFIPEKNSAEEKTLEMLKKGVEWAG